MADDIFRVESKVDKIAEDITEIKVIMARNTASLDEHMKRTALLEEQVRRVDDDIEPIKLHVNFMNKVFALLPYIGKGIVGALTVWATLKALGFL